MAYTKYSLTPANNTAAPPDGAPEGMLPSAVNDTMRDMMAQIRDCGDGIRDGTYTMTAPKITGGTITGAALTGNTLTNPVVSGGTITNATITGGSVSSVTFSSSAATITGGSVTGITDLSIADGGTGASTAAAARTNLGLDGFVNMKNRIINGGMDIAQRGTSFTSGANNNDAYVLDRFYILSDGNDAIDVTQTTTVPTGAKYSIGLDVETTNKKFGIAQIIENANCFDAIGGAVTLSFQAKVSATTKLDNVKCAIVAWSGTADSVTSDIISAWGAEGTNPTLIANATYENTPANLNVTTSFATYSVTANVDTASTSNIIVFIWSDVTDTTAGDFLYITNIQLEKGSTATSFDYRPIGTELALAQRYYQQIGGNSFVGNPSYPIIGNGFAFSINQADIYVPLRVTMRSTPTITSSGTAIQVVGTAYTVTSIGDVGSTFNTVFLRISTAGTFTAGDGALWSGNNSATSYGAFSSEL